MPKLQNYKRDLDYSYTPGIFPSMELLNNAPEYIQRLLIDESKGGEGLEKLVNGCKARNIRIENATKMLKNISGKKNCHAALVFRKCFRELDLACNHVCLNSIMDSGNLGTILRTLSGFGIKDIAIIKPAVDVFEPHTVRASMGAVFSMRVQEFDSFEQYQSQYSEREFYPFMLDGSVPLREAAQKSIGNYTLIFGNEGSGLPDVFSTVGTPVRIPHNSDIDSLNLAIAVAIGAYEFTVRKAMEG